MSLALRNFLHIKKEVETRPEHFQFLSQKTVVDSGKSVLALDRNIKIHGHGHSTSHL